MTTLTENAEREVISQDDLYELNILYQTLNARTEASELYESFDDIRRQMLGLLFSSTVEDLGGHNNISEQLSECVDEINEINDFVNKLINIFGEAKYDITENGITYDQHHAAIMAADPGYSHPFDPQLYYNSITNS